MHFVGLSVITIKGTILKGSWNKIFQWFWSLISWTVNIKNKPCISNSTILSRIIGNIKHNGHCRYKTNFCSRKLGSPWGRIKRCNRHIYIDFYCYLQSSVCHVSIYHLYIMHKKICTVCFKVFNNIIYSGI